MRLERLDLTRYGRFTDRSLDFPAPAAGEPDLHVIYGPNEAGKSTLFSAWMDLLYGIPLRSKYDFLHAGPLMRLGARLSGNGAALEIGRVKRNTGSLLDGAGQPLPESVLQGLLGGISREGYAAMFSLDDDTLEEGGDAILSSRGDLGEMLFSASAGLAGLAPQLDAMRKALDAFHKPGGRKTALKAQRDRLKELDAQREALDTSAARLQRLQRDRAAAERDWQAAAQAEAGVLQALTLVRQSLTLLPHRARVDRLRQELAALQDHPGAQPEDAAELARIDQDLRQLEGQAEARVEARASIEARRSTLARDPGFLPLADEIARVEGMRAPHLTALDDLPRRRQDLAEAQAEAMAMLRHLDLAGPPEAEVLPGPLLSRLRALASAWAPLMSAVETARREARAAAEELAEAAETAPALDLQSLGTLLASLRSEDPEGALTRALRDLDQREAELATALAALAPWSGAAEALPTPPGAWQLDALTKSVEAAAQGLATARQALSLARAELDRLPPPPGSAPPSLADAAEIRRRREAAWAQHLAQLTAASAAAFEALMRLDDQTSLRLSESLGALETEARRAALSAEVAAAEGTLRTAEALAAEAAAEGTALAGALGLPGAGLADLAAWTQRLHQAHAARQARDAARRAETRAAQAVTQAAATLAAALNCAPAPFALLKAEAQTRLDRAAQADEARRRRERLLTQATQRDRALAEAEAALQAWAAEWQALAPATLPAGEGMLARLEGLDQLSRQVERAALQSDRIAKMEANSAAFSAAAAALLARMGLDPATPWDEIPPRLARARQAEELHRQLEEDLTRLTLAEEEAGRTRARLQASRAALGQRLGWDGSLSLTDHLAEGLKANDLRRALAETEAELAAHPAEGVGDAPTLEAEIARLQGQLTLARDETSRRYAALTAVQAELDRVGGDDAVARLASDRANLVLQLAEEARTHLADRLALITLEAGLRRYRESHRSAMLARASDAFRTITLGAYAGLGAEPEGASEVLVALPAQGGSKRAEDLSKGTRFQLYLALRIAGYHELSTSRPPVPFIADDIFETFDNDRSARSFGLLAEMSRRGQVIYLTHHSHLCDIALAACPGARLLDLTALR